MELRHLHCFLVATEKPYFARAAERLHIEQSLLSQAIKEPGEELHVVQFVRTISTTRTIRSTWLTRARAFQPLAYDEP